MNQIPVSRVLLTLAALSLLVCSRADEKKPGITLADYFKRVGYEQVPLKRGRDFDSGVYLTAQIRGKEYRLLVDTGWGFTTLDEKVARQFKTLGELGVELEDTLLGRITNRDIVLVDNLTLGRARFLNQPARALKFSMERTRVGCEGILGADFFIRNQCLIDCAGPSLFVRAKAPPNEVTGALRTSLRTSGFMSVPMQARTSGTVQAKINDQPVALLVDTGAVFTTLDAAVAKRLDLKMVKRDQPKLGTLIPDDLSAYFIGMGKIGAHEGHVTILNSLQLDQYSWTNFPVAVTELKYWNTDQVGQLKPAVQGLLGAEILTRNEALIDYAADALWFRPRK